MPQAIPFAAAAAANVATGGVYAAQIAFTAAFASLAVSDYGRAATRAAHMAAAKTPVATAAEQSL